MIVQIIDQQLLKCQMKTYVKVVWLGFGGVTLSDETVRAFVALFCMRFEAGEVFFMFFLVLSPIRLPYVSD